MDALVEQALRSASPASSFRVPALPFHHRVFRLPDDPCAYFCGYVYIRHSFDPPIHICIWHSFVLMPLYPPFISISKLLTPRHSRSLSTLLHPPKTAAQELEGLYHRLLKRIGYHPSPSTTLGPSSSSPSGAGANPPQGPAREDEEDGSGPAPYSPLTAGQVEGGAGQLSSVPAYNLVMTRRWLMAVPRKQREYLGVRLCI